MKRFILILILLPVLAIGGDRGQKAVFAQEAQLGYEEEVRFGRIQDMVVFKDELYFLITDTQTSRSQAAIYKYVDEKTPPILQLAPDYMPSEETKQAYLYDRDDSKFKDKLPNLISFEIYNEELYAGGPLGIFKLNKAKGRWEYVEFNYGFDYLEQYGISIGFIRVAGNELYGIVYYRGVFEDQDLKKKQETNVTAFVKLAGKTWQLVARPYFGYFSRKGLFGVTDLEFLNGQFFASEDSSVKALVEEKTESYWQDISTDRDWDLHRFVKLAVFNSGLYSCGESTSTVEDLLTGGRVYVLKSISKDKEGELIGDWEESFDSKRNCEFMDVVNGELFVGTRYYGFYDGKKINYEVEKNKIKPLYRFNGSEWKEIDFSNAPGLTQGQIVDGVTAVVSFKGKIFLAVLTSLGEYELNPGFYILEGSKLTPLSWFKVY